MPEAQRRARRGRPRRSRARATARAVGSPRRATSARSRSCRSVAPSKSAASHAWPTARTSSARTRVPRPREHGRVERQGAVRGRRRPRRRARGRDGRLLLGLDEGAFERGDGALDHRPRGAARCGASAQRSQRPTLPGAVGSRSSAWATPVRSAAEAAARRAVAELGDARPARRARRRRRRATPAAMRLAAGRADPRIDARRPRRRARARRRDRRAPRAAGRGAARRRRAAAPRFASAAPRASRPSPRRACGCIAERPRGRDGGAAPPVEAEPDVRRAARASRRGAAGRAARARARARARGTGAPDHGDRDQRPELAREERGHEAEAHRHEHEPHEHGPVPATPAGCGPPPATPAGGARAPRWRRRWRAEPGIIARPPAERGERVRPRRVGARPRAGSRGGSGAASAAGSSRAQSSCSRRRSGSRSSAIARAHLRRRVRSGVADGRRVARGAREPELQHAEELLPLALDLRPRRARAAGRARRTGCRGSRVDVPSDRVRSAHPRVVARAVLLWRRDRESFQRSSTMGFGAPPCRRARSPALPSRTSACALTMSVA